MTDFLLPLLGFVATFTILFGNLAACAQQKLNVFGLSGVAHAGYLLVAVMASMHLAGIVTVQFGLSTFTCHVPIGFIHYFWRDEPYNFG